MELPIASAPDLPRLMMSEKPSPVDWPLTGASILEAPFPFNIMRTSFILLILSIRIGSPAPLNALELPIAAFLAIHDAKG